MSSLDGRPDLKKELERAMLDDRLLAVHLANASDTGLRLAKDDSADQLKGAKGVAKAIASAFLGWGLIFAVAYAIYVMG